MDHYDRWSWWDTHSLDSTYDINSPIPNHNDIVIYHFTIISIVIDISSSSSSSLSSSSSQCSPEPNDPQDAVVATMFKDRPGEFQSTARFWTDSYAKPAVEGVVAVSDAMMWWWHGWPEDNDHQPPLPLLRHGPPLLLLDHPIILTVSSSLRCIP